MRKKINIKQNQQQLAQKHKREKNERKTVLKEIKNKRSVYEAAIKESEKQRTKYFDNNNNEIEFNGGMIWVEIVPDEDYLRY